MYTMLSHCAKMRAAGDPRGEALSASCVDRAADTLNRPPHCSKSSAVSSAYNRPAFQPCLHVTYCSCLGEFNAWTMPVNTTIVYRGPC